MLAWSPSWMILVSYFQQQNLPWCFEWHDGGYKGQFSDMDDIGERSWYDGVGKGVKSGTVEIIFEKFFLVLMRRGWSGPASPSLSISYLLYCCCRNWMQICNVTYSTTYSNVFQRSKKCLASKSDIVSLQHLRLELVIWGVCHDIWYKSSITWISLQVNAP